MEPGSWWRRLLAFGVSDIFAGLVLLLLGWIFGGESFFSLAPVIGLIAVIGGGVFCVVALILRSRARSREDQ